MRWMRFTAGGRTAYGIVEGSEIVDVTGDPFARSTLQNRLNLAETLGYERQLRLVLASAIGW